MDIATEELSQPEVIGGTIAKLNRDAKGTRPYGEVSIRKSSQNNFVAL